MWNFSRFLPSSTRNIFSTLNSLVNTRMSTAEILKRLESNATAAEELIASLKLEVNELKRNRKEASLSQQTALVLENEQLRADIEAYKNELIKLETEHGIAQVLLPGIKNGPPVATIKSEQTQDSSISTEVSEKPDVKPKSLKTKKEKPTVEGKKTSNVKTPEGPSVDVSRLDFRVGKIVNVRKHPDADSLYVEEIDVGEEKTRTVVSGLVNSVPIEELQNRMVIVLCNLKPVKMRGITSEAMVMCASSSEKVEVLIPPANVVPGDLVHVDGYPRVPDTVLNPKKKIFETCAPDLKTDEQKQAVYKGVPLQIPGKGSITTSSLIGVQVK